MGMGMGSYMQEVIKLEVCAWERLALKLLSVCVVIVLSLIINNYQPSDFILPALTHIYCQ